MRLSTRFLLRKTSCLCEIGLFGPSVTGCTQAIASVAGMRQSFGLQRAPTIILIWMRSESRKNIQENAITKGRKKENSAATHMGKTHRMFGRFQTSSLGT